MNSEKTIEGIAELNETEKRIGKRKQRTEYVRTLEEKSFPINIYGYILEAAYTFFSMI